jgi:phosphoglycerol transferase MdoB-like AlkP superfamily enzyme
MENIQIAFFIVALLAMAGMVLASRQDKWVVSLMLVWATLIAGLSWTGFFENTESQPPRFVFVLLPASVLTYLAYRRLQSQNLSVSLLIAMHILRIPVELILYQLFLQAQVPELMTYQGWNFDILSGISAVVILVLYVIKKLNRWVFLSWNWMGLGLLAIIVVVAVLSSPTPLQQFAFEQPNVAVLKFPFIWLPAVVVPIVLLSHLLLIRHLNHGGRAIWVRRTQKSGSTEPSVKA